MSIARREAKWKIACTTLRGAGQSAGAARDRLAFLAHDFRSADRAMRGHLPWLRARRTFVEHDADDFGNDVAGTAHDDCVADAHVEPRNLVGVVQRRVGHGDAADEHRLELRRRRRRAGAADVDDDVLDRRRLLLRRKLVRDRPARRASDEAEFALAGAGRRACRPRRRCRTAACRAARRCGGSTRGSLRHLRSCRRDR